MQWIAALAALVQMFAWSAVAWSAVAWCTPAEAQNRAGQRAVITTSWVEEWDSNQQQWVRVSELVSVREARTQPAPVARANANRHATVDTKTSRFTAGVARPDPQSAMAQYGPFIVLDPRRAAIMGSTDGASPGHFDAMMRDFPGLKILEMVEAPGTSNDIANLAVGRRIRGHGLETHVPGYGSVRSGAVELFLAGARRSVDRGAWFAVHSWLDNHGREPDDFAPDDPANRLYVDYYMEMGMSEERARAFYAMTNSVPHHSAKWLRAEEMEPWIRPEVVVAPPPVTLPPLPLDFAVLDLPVNPPVLLLAYQDLTMVSIAGLGRSEAKPFLDS